ncbi:N-acetyl-gamma-glutamyl-phosphate reductase [Candidatus Bathyarchaeota archaeon]|jgi:N-acetyl-gamma-glutamyl-phosphate reductase common form|nr:N-acetyl-gamma-glutamyl-phosphate reductase [Candidatus Bathyarchaeota archaeon]
MAALITVGIYGASGYVGGEALRILNEHPQIRVAWATSRSGKSIEYFHRNLYGSGIHLIKPEEASYCDTVLLSLPSGNAMTMVPDLLKNGTKIIDLGADFRLQDHTEWERIYGRTHSCWNLVNEAIYGIPELHRDQIRKARIIANPGCFSSASILGLAPLIKEEKIDTERIVIDGLSGTAGAGSELDITMHHPEIGNNLVPYNVVDHRHTYEIEQELGLLAKKKVTINFTPAYVPITRGILAICHCFPVQKVSRNELLDLYKSFYRDEYFIKIFDMPKDADATWQYMPYPWVSAVSGTNFCHIGLDVDEKRNRVVVFSVLDSLGKGGAHAAVQNLNLLFNLEETMGLTRYGLHPY